jgi:ABC-2 type transport system permease protein
VSAAAGPQTAGLAGDAGRPDAGREPASSGRDNSLAGSRELARFGLHRDRVLLPVWIYALTAIAASGGYGIKFVYKTAAARAQLAASVRADPALSFLYGQLHGTSTGALVSWRYLTYAALGAGLMSIFVVIRHTRADEETGRLELVGSAAVGRNAALSVAVGIAALANVIVAVLAVAVLSVSGMPATGAVAFGLAEAGCGLVFAGLAAIAAQISGTARGARGLAISVLAVSFVLRAVGDSGGRHGLSWLTWLSPAGWAELTRPFAGERWWLLALPALACLAGIMAAFALAARRDQGAGLVQPRPGRPEAGRGLAGPVGLAWRLQRGTLAGWAVGWLLGGLAIGVVAQGIGQLIGSSGAVDKALRQIGGQPGLTNAYLAACMSLAGLVTAAYSVSAVLRLRSEETGQRAEPVLAGTIGRLRWAGSHLLVVLAGTAMVLAAAGLGMGLGYGAAVSDPGGQLARLLGAALAQLPATLAVAAIAVAAFGLLPQWCGPAGWTALAVCGVIGVFGPALNLPQAVLDISPFTHVPKLPGGVVTVWPLLWLTLFVLVVTGAGLAGLRRRDIG